MSERADRHDASHEEWIAGVLSGESRESPSAIDERLSRCAQCREEFESLRALSADLASDAQFERTVLEQAEREIVTPADLAALERMRAEKLGEPSSRPARRSIRGSLLVAAAILIGAAFVFRSFPPDDPAVVPDREMGGKLAMSPVGPCDSFKTFSFRYDRPKGGWFQIVIHPDGGGEPITSPHLLEPRWELSDEVLAKLTPRIIWRASVCDVDDQEIVSQTASAELRSH